MNRSDLVDTFGVSVPQATLDLSRYQELHPQNAEYDRSAKEYVPKASFAAAYPTSRLDGLLHLASERGSGRESRPSPADWLPSVETVRIPTRKHAEQVLLAVVEALRMGSGLLVTYQSMTPSSGTERTITPHALVDTGGRWHVRAYCHRRGDFRDFVVSRISKVHEHVEAGRKADDDREWNSFTDLVLTPRADLDPHQRSAIAGEYQMEENALTYSCRVATVFYALQLLGLEKWKDGRVMSRHLQLQNADSFPDHLVPRHDWQ